ncbi:winged helix-turn-helix domain-containing protein [Shewanella corallii]|uniref:Winged helix-turn-helix domain-containing protein n=1 Tax=Shewanella corallii TaxID=560080 RepID=A0ABT0NDI0_9GAMM|nr:winged helix-turn-helix domain-containing protein [Shewanella corallii]MCL2915832.1 winged helix-turn-helix domain-containing protein [Shewanella corallii]
MQTHKLYVLGKFYWNLNSGELFTDSKENPFGRKDGIKLTCKQQKLLEALFNSYPEVLCKDDLVEKIWGGRIMSPESLPQLINRTRSVLQDSDKSIIFNQPGEGYLLRFEEVSLEPVNTKEQNAHVSFRLPKTKLKWGAVCFLLALTIVNAKMLAAALNNRADFVGVTNSIPYPHVDKDSEGRVKSVAIGETTCEYEKALRKLRCGV